MKQVTDTTLPDHGERMIPAHHKGATVYPTVYGEHMVRYQAIAPLVRGKVVLDIASGSGYGSELMGAVAKEVIGVDVDAKTVAYATKNYGTKNVSFRVGDGVSIPLDDNSVDMVVSFETIEHIKDYTTFMAEVKRVLKPEGLLALSTPNDDEFIEGNHFHIHEFNEPELGKLVAKFFKHTKSYYQATWIYNAIGDKKILSDEWQAPIETMQLAPIPAKKAIYFFMLCANVPIQESVQSLAAISAHWSQREIQEQADAAQKHAHTLEAKVHAQEVLLQQQQAELSAITGSKAWKIASSLRRVKHAIKN